MIKITLIYNKCNLCAGLRCETGAELVLTELFTSSIPSLRVGLVLDPLPRAVYTRRAA